MWHCGFIFSRYTLHGFKTEKLTQKTPMFLISYFWKVGGGWLCCLCLAFQCGQLPWHSKFWMLTLTGSKSRSVNSWQKNLLRVIKHKPSTLAQEVAEPQILEGCSDRSFYVFSPLHLFLSIHLSNGERRLD